MTRGPLGKPGLGFSLAPCYSWGYYPPSNTRTKALVCIYIYIYLCVCVCAYVCVYNIHLPEVALHDLQSPVAPIPGCIKALLHRGLKLGYHGTELHGCTMSIYIYIYVLHIGMCMPT